jgi:hypothetical protein
MHLALAISLSGGCMLLNKYESRHTLSAAVALHSRMHLNYLFY